MYQNPEKPLEIAVIGSGISGMSAAWLLSMRHRVTLYEQAARLGGHTNTVVVPGPDGDIAVDTGFIVFNEPAYPNLTALFRHLDVATRASEMSFAVSLDSGRFEYAGTVAGRLSGAPTLRRRLPRRSSAADGGGDLVRTVADTARLSRRRIHPLLRKPWSP
jgi:predicted NAD/FAD-binding protein